MSALLFSYVTLFLISMVFILIFSFKERLKKVEGTIQAISKPKIKKMTVGMVWEVVSGRLPKNAKSGVTQLEVWKNLMKDCTFITAWFPTRTVIVGRYEEIRQIHASSDFDDRPISGLLNTRTSKAGILQNNGVSWKEVRRYSMKKLGQLGLGKKAQMESILCDETDDLLTHLNDLRVETGNKIYICDLFELSVINIIWGIAAGGKFTRGDPDFQHLRDDTQLLTNVSVIALFLGEFKLFRYLLLKYGPDTFACRGFYKAMKDTRKYFQGVVKNRYESGDFKYHENKDLIDSFLEEIDLHANSDKKEIFNFENLICFLADLFQAGMDTTSQTLNGIVMWMVKYPEVQRKIQKEIDEVVGRDRLPSYATDLNKLRYTQATLLEINRVTNMFAFNPRMAIKDTVLGDLPIQKGTHIFISYYPVRMCTKFWGDPYVFRPERFLDSENNLIKEKMDHILAFGGGSRVCIGESVATSTIFHFVTGILHRYNVTAADDTEILRMCDDMSVSNSVIPFHFSICPR